MTLLHIFTKNTFRPFSSPGTPWAIKTPTRIDPQEAKHARSHARNVARAEAKIRRDTRRNKRLDALGSGLTHSAVLAQDMPQAVFLRLQAAVAGAKGDHASALRLYGEAADALVAGLRDTRVPWAVVRHTRDAHAYASRIQRLVARRIRQRIASSVKIAAAFRGYRVRYQVFPSLSVGGSGGAVGISTVAGLPCGGVGGAGGA